MEIKVLGLRPKVESPGSSETLDPIEFEASGLGGILPADNFSISVRRRQAVDKSMNVEGEPTPTDRGRIRSYPMHIRSALERSTPRQFPPGTPNARDTRFAPIFKTEIVASRVRDLVPSTLPQPSYYQFSSTGTDDVEESSENADLESHSDDSSGSPDDISIAARPGGSQQFPLSTSKAGSTATGIWNATSPLHDDVHHNPNNDNSDDSSIDKLAQARCVDAAAGRRREREVDSSHACGLAGEIPAGSSAATAEGGSGFNSPFVTAKTQNPALGEVISEAAERTRWGPVTLKRARKSDDSVLVHGGPSRKSPKLEGSDGRPSPDRD